MNIETRKVQKFASRIWGKLLSGMLCAGMAVFPCLAGSGIPMLAKNMGLIKINGADLYFRVVGEGKPLIVLHGGPGLSHEYFLPHLETLVDEFQLIFYDQRASGNSSAGVAPESISIEGFVADLEGIRKRFGLDKVSLLGHSWGGLLALHYALKFPEKTQRMILVDAAPPNAKLDVEGFKAMEARRSEEDTRRIKAIMASEAFQKLEPSAIAEYLRASEKVRFYRTELISLMRMSLDREKILKLMRVGRIMRPQLADYDIVQDLSAVTCPILVVHGDCDTIPVDSARLIHEQVKDSRLIIVKNCGHFPFIEAPERFTKAVKAFLHETRNGDAY